MIKKVLIINGVERTLVLEGTETLAKVLRERLMLTGCKIGCGEGQIEGHKAFHVSSLYVTSSYSLVDQKMELSTSSSSKLRHRKLSSP